MSVEGRYNIMKGLTEKKRWVKPEISLLRVKNTKNGATVQTEETFSNTLIAYS